LHLSRTLARDEGHAGHQVAFASQVVTNVPEQLLNERNY